MHKFFVLETRQKDLENVSATGNRELVNFFEIQSRQGS
jgi:hypothetical protein